MLKMTVQMLLAEWMNARATVLIEARRQNVFGDIKLMNVASSAAR